MSIRFRWERSWPTEPQFTTWESSGRECVQKKGGALPMTDYQGAVDWLLSSDEPAVRLLTRRDVLCAPGGDDPNDVLKGPKVIRLLSGQKADGGFGGPGGPYRKWVGAHWRLVALVELAVPSDEPRVAAAVEHELAWIARQAAYRDGPPEADGLARMCGSIGGNALAVSSLLGRADDPRARLVAETLIAAQWPDGGWNCKTSASGRRSSFHETLSPAWALHQYAEATGHRAARDAADRAAELFLEHRLIYSLGTGIAGQGRTHRHRAGEVINPRWLELRYPSYWHYDLLQALLILSRLGKVDDPRAHDALDHLEQRCLPDGRWPADGRWWNVPDSKTTPEVVDWGTPGQPNEMITLNALRVLRAAGRLDDHQDAS